MYRLPYPCMYSYMNYSCVGLHECIHEYTDTYMRRCIICISDRFFFTNPNSKVNLQNEFLIRRSVGCSAVFSADDSPSIFLHLLDINAWSPFTHRPLFMFTFISFRPICMLRFLSVIIALPRP